MKWTLIMASLVVTTLCRAQNELAMLKPSLKDLPIEAPVGGREYRTVSFRIVDKMITMEAQLDGQDGVVILDTGSPGILVNREPGIHDRSLRAATLGDEVEIHETVIEQFRLGELLLRDLPGLAMPFGAFASGHSEPVIGLAGYSLLKDYEILLDYENRRLHLFPPQKAVLHRVARPVREIHLDMEGHLPVLILQVGERRFRFGLDTGAATNIIDVAHLRDLPEELLRFLPVEQMRCLDGPYRDVEAAAISRLSVDGYPLEPMKFLFADLSGANQHTGEPLDGLLGYDFFRQLLCSINYHQGKFFIWQRAQTSDAL